MSPFDRFASKTQIEGKCIVWTGHVNADGYGQFWYDGKAWYAHRWLYFYHMGRVPVELGHSCHNRRCVVHVRELTHAENMKEMWERQSRKFKWSAHAD